MRFLSLLVCAVLLLGTSALAESTFPPSSVPVIHGIDVSAWQRDIDWQAVHESGVTIAILRASEGTTVIDAQFERNYTGAKAAGMAVGFYHFMTATTVQEAQAQADFFLNVIAGKVPDCLLALDVGSAGNLSNEMLTEIALAFMERVEAQSGYRIMLYTDAYAARARFGAVLSRYPIWVANYGVQEPEANGKWSSWVGFQYGDRGDVPGIDGRVDLDYFTAEVYQGAAPTPAPTATPIITDELQCQLLDEDTSLDVLAEALQVSLETLRSLNTLPNDQALAGQLIRYPGAGQASGSFAGLHVLQRFENLSTIARRYGVSTASLQALNGLIGQSARLGQVIKVPAVGYHDATVPAWVTENAIMVQSGDTFAGLATRYGMSAQELATINGLSIYSTLYQGQLLRLTAFGNGSTGAFRGGYVVQVNDTLDRIAERFEVEEDALYQLNNLATRNLIFPGMVLLIP